MLEILLDCEVITLSKTKILLYGHWIKKQTPWVVLRQFVAGFFQSAPPIKTAKIA
ncbi:MAG: hypothetical protein OPY06_04925 [Nitrosopumilus sp.]|nr:hypothetical protein [Nitrosopumilus sp.]MDF2423178.1 hypothetical protein [Nitrosopumilus sp.]MDF2426019.1 hypothetical protein [Nitrosopumilus sp.]MDF2427511.1 hypothetical protein [Nitrosopumilus sp.]MDF2427633.1 hypothetical protein [Nitrosopumilus sp.]